MTQTLILQHWNAVTDKEAKPLTKRQHVRASELGMPMIDRYLRMTGVEPSNEISHRVLRIFDAGKVIEFIVMRTLAAAGILNQKQEAIELPESKRYLGIKGYLDATIGGFASWDDADARVVQHLESLGMDIDDIVSEKAKAIHTGLRVQFPDGWKEEMVVECKSINSQAFHHYRNQPGGFRGYDHNRLQLFSYLVMKKLRQGILLYVSKDDFSLAEIPISIYDSDLRKAFKADLEQITHYIRTNTRPDPEPEIVFNEKKRVFEINWNVSRSPYLKLVYGHDTPETLEAQYHQEILDINRALRHLRDDKVKQEDVPVIEKHLLENYK